jgi:hypothetical protein
MKKSGVVLFGLAIGLFIARPVPVAGDWICTGPLSTCNSVSVSFTTYGSGSAIMQVTINNQLAGGAPLSSFSLSIPGITPTTTYYVSNAFPSWSGSLGDGAATFTSSWPVPQYFNGTFQVTFMNGQFGTNPQIQLASVNGEELASSGEGVEPGGDPTGMPGTHAPEPATILLLATGLIGIGLAHRRRRSALED